MAPLSKEQELASLNAQKEALEQQMEAVKKRLEELEKEA
jgi:prefoldin subunit 5